MYKADVPNVTEPTEPTELTGTLTGASQIAVGNKLEVNYGLAHVSTNTSDAIFAQDLTFNYDPDTFLLTRQSHRKLVLK